MLNNIRLLFVMYDRPNYPGGPIINYTRLLPKLKEKGYDVHALVLFNDDYPNAQYIEQMGVTIHCTPFLESTKKEILWILEKVKHIKPKVFIPDVSTPGCLATKWIRKWGIPCINSHRSNDDLNWGKAFFFSDKKYNYTTDAIFCVSNVLKEELLLQINNPNLITKVIPSGVMIPFFQSAQSPFSLKIVYAGRLVQKQKRIIETINVFLSIAQKIDNTFFTIIGDGPDFDNCFKIVDSSIYKERFLFTGNLQGEDYKHELAKNDVIILLSDYEGVPGSLLDGMSCGLIPIGYNYKGVSEVINNNVNGFVVNDRDDSVLNVVNNLINNHEIRLQMSNNAKYKIIKYFSIDYCISQWDELIKECLNLQLKPNKIKVPRKIKIPKDTKLLVEFKQSFEDTMNVFQKMRYHLKLRTRVNNIFSKK